MASKQTSHPKNQIFLGPFRPFWIIVTLTVCSILVVNYYYTLGIAWKLWKQLLIALTQFFVAIPFVALFSLIFNGKVRQFRTSTFVFLLVCVLLSILLLAGGYFKVFGLTLKTSGAFLLLNSCILGPALSFLGMFIYSYLSKKAIPDPGLDSFPIADSSGNEIEYAAMRIRAEFSKMNQRFKDYADQRASVATNCLKEVFDLLGLLKKGKYPVTDNLNLLSTINETAMHGELGLGFVPILVRYYNRVVVDEESVIAVRKLCESALDTLTYLRRKKGEPAEEVVQRTKEDIHILLEHVETMADYPRMDSHF